MAQRPKELADLRGKLERPELCQPTDDHWLLIDEAVWLYVVNLNGDQIAEVNQQLFALASKGDGILKCRRTRRPPLHVTIDFDGLIDRFFWDTDFVRQQRSTSRSIRGRHSRWVHIQRRSGSFKVWLPTQTSGSWRSAVGERTQLNEGW